MESGIHEELAKRPFECVSVARLVDGFAESVDRERK